MVIAGHQLPKCHGPKKSEGAAVQSHAPVASPESCSGCWVLSAKELVTGHSVIWFETNRQANEDNTGNDTAASGTSIFIKPCAPQADG